MFRKPTSRFDARVLVVDDYLINQELTKEFLEKMGCSVDLADDGEEALLCLDTMEYDLIFMDIQMPQLDGYQATQKIRQAEKKDKHTPIIALTANALSGDREKCLRAGMDDYLGKPVRCREIEELLIKFLSQQRIAF
ncbi:MAG: histidine kinase [SAR324 cluster bacterium]|uniref:Histidine kinase n=1 Tax=SAR324 cluster bacterium TaxID=2024889 RepID=A0A2A4T5L7_9DELT|nr:MAG: histidine kinase [SAR324 cluster bacterium]